MEKINIAELLKDCPTGMELDCVMYENVYFDKINGDKKSYYPIFCYITDEKGNRSSILFTKNGCESIRYGAKCVIFPKGKTTWEGFQRPFKDGDILATDLGSVFFLKTRLNTDECYGCYVGIGGDGSFHICEPFAYKECCGLATEEEKEKLFQAIKANGYKWNEETKTLEKLVEPKFKVGDRITNKDKFIYRITEVTDKGYKLHDLKTTFITFEEADSYFVKVVDVFDIATLVPFESRVLVRSTNEDIWRPAIYGFTDSDRYYVVGGIYWKKCIPYNEETKHLLGTTNDCDEYYKTWE